MIRREKQAAQQEEVQVVGIRNDRFWACWPTSFNTAYKFENGNDGKPSFDAFAQFKPFEPLNILPFCHGDGGRLFPSLLEDTKSSGKWVARRGLSRNGSDLVLIDYVENKSQHPMMTFQLDPNRGFLVTAKKSFHDSGAVYSEAEYSVEQVGADRVWVPVRIARRFGSGSPSGLASDLVLENIKVNEPVASSQFDIGALGLTKAQTLIVKPRGSGRSTAEKIVGGQSIPLKMYEAVNPANAGGTATPAVRPVGSIRDRPSRSIWVWSLAVCGCALLVFIGMRLKERTSALPQSERMD